jgi:hypothetical protein
MRAVQVVRACLPAGSFCWLALVLCAAQAARAQDVAPPTGTTREALSDAWWTGPMLAPSAGTLPPGHFLIEPYLYVVTAPHSNTFGSRSYIIYGLANRFSIGVIPVFGFNQVSDGPSSSGVGLGDFSLMGQFRLTQFHPGSWVPTMSINLQETFPTGKYDRLGDRPSDGLGAGAFMTTASFYSQSYFWMPTGRILRARFNASQSFSSGVSVHDVSVYGTDPGFRGHANPGSSTSLDLAGEYSLTRNWVLALDAVYAQSATTLVSGSDVLGGTSAGTVPGVHLSSGASAAFAFAPAIEYNWCSSTGILLGVRLVPRGLNTAATVTPAIAINMVR